MSTSKKKKSKGRQKSKAAIERDRLRGDKAGVSQGENGSVEVPQYRGGVMSNMRGGFQSAVGQGETKGKGSTLNNIVWIALIGAAAFMLVKQFQ